MKYLARFLLGALYVAIPIIGWFMLYQSIKRVKSDEISMIQNFSGKAELIEEGVYFRPFPGDRFSESYSKESDFIDFGPLKRVRVRGGQIAYKTLGNGKLIELAPGMHVVNTALNETFDPARHIKNNQEDYIDFGALKIVRVRPGKLGVKTNKEGVYVELEPGTHIIDAAEGETFEPTTGIQDIGKDDFILGNFRYINIRNGELGESYKDGIFYLLEAGKHKLPANHRFIKKVAVDSDVIDLGALKIVTVKEGQVAVVNTQDGVIVKGAGKHIIKQSEGNYFNAIITTCPRGITLPPLTVMCSDQIEMRAESMLTFKVDEPLKTVGLGIENIIKFLEKIADGTLRTILSRFSSSDIAPSLHTDEEHRSSKRHERLKTLHDECVSELDNKAKEWGLSITDLQITQILPADEVYLSTVRELGSRQISAEAQRRLADNEADIAQIRAKAVEAKVTTAHIEQKAAVVDAETKALTQKILAEAKASQLITEAKAQAESTTLKAEAEACRIKKLNDATKDAPQVTQDIMRIEAQGKVLAQIENPVFIQPGLGDTSVLSRNTTNGSLRFFTTKPGQTSLVDALTLQASQTQLAALSSPK